MNTEILAIAEQMKDAWQGDPWFGRNTLSLLEEVSEKAAFEKPSGQHSVVELVWHMVTWKEFVISRLRADASKDLHYFERADWRDLDHSNRGLWKEGLQKLQAAHNELVEVVQAQKDNLLDEKVAERTYTFRKLLYGVLQHDIYHLGQIAYIVKLLK